MAVGSRLILLAMAMMSLPLVPHPALALELFGICLSGDCEKTDEASDLIDPHSYSVDFIVVTPSADEVAPGAEDAARGGSQLWSGRDAPVAGAAGLVARAKGDYRRILAALQDVGHYSASVSILIAGSEVTELGPGAEIPDGSEVQVRVDTGPMFRFGQAEIANAAPPPSDPHDVVKTPQEDGYGEGLPAGAERIRTAARLSRDAWREQGHPLARLEGQQVRALHAQRLIDSRLVMDPGPRADFGEVVVQGTRRMDPAFVAYMSGIPTGREYDPDELERARKRLDRLGVFSTRRIEEAKALAPDGTLPLTLVVSERKPRRFGIGATYSSIDGGGIEGYFLHRNLFGRAESLRFDAKIGGLGQDFDPDRLDYSLGMTFTRPGTLSPDTDLVGTLLATRDVNETFTETSIGGTAGFTHYASEEVTLKLGAFAEQGRFRDSFGERNFTTTGLTGEAILDYRDNRLEPTSGTYLGGKMRPFYEWQYGNPAVQFEIDGRAYADLTGDGRTVLAGRARTGALIGPEADELPPDLTFLEGGGGSLRGYAYRNVGVVDATGAVVGGRSMATFSAEIRQRINDSFGVVGFADAGTVSASPFIDFSEPMKIGVGGGIRYYTGLGAIRLDVAVPLDPGPDDPGFGIYAGIGQAF